MVTRNVVETKNEPEYSLAGAQRLASFKQLNYMGRRVQVHVANLHYSFDDVCQAIIDLRERDFHCSEKYENVPKWHDVYLLPNPVPENPDERLYVKFRVTPDFVSIELCSFHPEGWL